MQVTLNSRTFEIRQNAQGLFSLNDLRNAWAEAGGVERRLCNWKVSPDYLQAASRLNVVAVPGVGNGTWGCTRALIAYAGYCDKRVKVAVVNAVLELASKLPLPEPEPVYIPVFTPAPTVAQAAPGVIPEPSPMVIPMVGHEQIPRWLLWMCKVFAK